MSIEYTRRAFKLIEAYEKIRCVADAEKIKADDRTAFWDAIQENTIGLELKLGPETTREDLISLVVRKALLRDDLITPSDKSVAA